MRGKYQNNQEESPVAKHQSKHSSQQQISSTGIEFAENSFGMQLQELLKQKKYRQALEEIKKIQRSHPEIQFSPKESEIWLLRGQQEFQKQDFKQAEKSFGHSLELGLLGDVHYWEARCMLELNKLDAALKLLRDAFEAGTLIKEYCICYLKLLLLKGDIATVEQLINQQSKRFSAAQLHWVRGVLALKHCWMADAYMALHRDRAALGALQQAERIYPTSSEVLGRKGLLAALEDNYTEAIALITQAIEGGCRYGEIYGTLLNCWQALEDKQAYNEARRRFGKHFGDLNLETEVEILPWIDALSTGIYPLFSRIVQGKDKKDPAIHACQIFVNAVKSPPNSGGRVSLDQKAAVEAWDTLLEKLSRSEQSRSEQIVVLQAIALSFVRLGGDRFLCL
jgi:tetratricopeptide (TPR) repeat protein